MRGYSTLAWQRARRRALAHARYRCTNCGRGSREVVLVVHHLDEQGVLGTRAHEQANLRVLCRGCHNTEHGRRA